MGGPTSLEHSGPSTAPTPVVPPSVVEGDSWRRPYRNAVVAIDVLAVALATAVGLLVTRELLGLAAGAVVVGALAVTHAWDPKVLHVGAVEIRRVYRAVLGAAALVGLVGFALGWPQLRPWAFAVLPAAGVLVVSGRYLVRKHLHSARHDGRCLQPVLAVGTVESVTDLVDRTRRDRYFGWDVVAVCVDAQESEVAGVPVIGRLDDVADLSETGTYSVVAVGPAPGWGPKRLRSLAWALEGTGVELAVDPGLMEIAGPRMHIAPVDGLPLLRLTQPTFSGGGWVLKQTIDRLGALLLVVLLSPMFLALALAVRADGGPAFFLQERVGVNGRRFRMVKFRSMVVDADRMIPQMREDNDGAGPLFKLRSDPRVTRVGAVLRRYSLDELPQLFNVVAGSMSLVGPRPPLPREVATYGNDARRRLLVRPGMTGLWQVSGRSDLSWADSVRLDLRYVENWSLALDVEILWKTVGAVVGSRGAY